MKQFDFPTTLIYGEGALEELSLRIAKTRSSSLLLVTDKTLVEVGIVSFVMDELVKRGLKVTIYDGTDSNPTEDNVLEGAEIYKEHKCDAVVALGGGSPMDVAKGVVVMAKNDGPLAKYDNCFGGERHITNPLPPLYAIPTTAGTGSEVGRSGVIIIKETNDKTIIFHPDLLPKMAALDPVLTKGLPPHITAATGIDAFTHSLEAYFSPEFHPMADGIALEGMKIILDNLETAVREGENIEARSKMLIASSMGATAFQKGLGMTHSIAHPLSSECGLHHGLANAIMLPFCIAFLEESNLSEFQREKIADVQGLFEKRNLSKETLSQSCKSYFERLGIKSGLSNYNVTEDQIKILSEKALKDPCHQTNMIPVDLEDFKKVIRRSLS